MVVTLHELGVCLRKAGPLDDTEELLRHCLALRAAKLGVEHVQVANTMRELCKWVRLRGWVEEVTGLVWRSLETVLG